MKHTLVPSILAVALVLSSFPSIAAAQLAGRESDPVVLNGASLPNYLGTDPSSIVAFRYEGGWIQIPVQVDERALVDFGRAYGDTLIGISTYCYTDTSTFVGADPDPAFDGDDELVFMAADCGAKAPQDVQDPAGTVPFTRLELEVTDPLNSNSGYAYLFLSDGSLAPHAGSDYVSYTFDLLSGPYKTTYDTYSGPNPENSEVLSSYYRTHFSDRWIRDELEVYADSSTGVDILDRHKSLFAPGDCSRSEDTFSNGEGGFFTNKDGPVRSIRSYVGANSGPLTQREHIFYAARQDITTFLRVHAISGIMDFYDYSPEAAGMTYYNDLDQGGVTVDGVPDAVTTGAITWEMVTGPQGTLVVSHSTDTDIPDPSYTSYYSDDDTPATTQCTGDGFEYGASGPWVDHSIPNTDPLLTPPVYTFTSRRIVYYEGPGMSPALAAGKHERAQAPLTVRVTPTAVSYAGGPPGMELLQNFPNPFSTVTTVGFRVRPGARAKLEIFDVTGRRIAVIFEGKSDKGIGRAVWNGRDVSGKLVSAGVYFYRLRAEGFSRVKKMVFLSP